MKFSYCECLNPNKSSFGMEKNGQNKIKNDQYPNGHLKEEGSSSSAAAEDLSLRNLSKLILPPLGSSGYSQNQQQVLSKGKIISPMDSRYRLVYFKFLQHIIKAGIELTFVKFLLKLKCVFFI